MVDDPKHGASPLYLPEGYAKRTRSKTEGVAKTGKTSTKGTVTHTEHWDGSVDATVRPGPISMKLTNPLGAPPDPDHVKAIARYEKAIRRLDFARKGNDTEFLRRAEQEVYDAQRHLEATQ